MNCYRFSHNTKIIKVVDRTFESSFRFFSCIVLGLTKEITSRCCYLSFPIIYEKLLIYNQY
jgi:hypothetical protein